MTQYLYLLWSDDLDRYARCLRGLPMLFPTREAALTYAKRTLRDPGGWALASIILHAPPPPENTP